MGFLRFFAWVGASLITLGLMASAQADGTHELNHVTFVAPIRVGGTLLPAGDYDVRHTMEGAAHVMVFQSANHKRTEVKAHCQLVQLGAKADRTRTVYELNAAGERVLQELVFGGDSVKHVFF